MSLGLILLLTTPLAPSASAGAPVWLGQPPAKVLRVVSLAPAITEILFALGAGDRVVGVTRFDDFPPAVLLLPKVGGFIDPDPEAVLALAPDLAVAVPTSGGRHRVQTLARLGLPVLVVPGETVDDLWTAIAAVGAAVGRQERAAELVAELRAELLTLKARHEPTRLRRALVVVGHRPLVAAGPGSFLDSLLGYVGAVNVVTRGGAYPTLDLEAVTVLDPEMIIDLTRAGHEAGEVFWQRLAQLPAVRAGRLYELDDAALLRPGPRLPAALATLTARLVAVQP